MATVRSPKPTASAKYDAFVEEQLAKAQRRVRLLDVSSALLLFAAATLVYALAVGLIDRKLDFTPFTRQVAFTAYAVAAAVFLAVGVVRPLLRRVNPYYAARAVEGVVPGAKNSVVNWLDLHGAALPAAIRSALGQRAAKDLGNADLERAISGRRAVWLTGLTALLLFVTFGVLVTSGVGGFGTLLARVFTPFGGGATARRTQLTLVRPINGDAVLGVGQSFDVAVRVEGRVPDPQKPDALRLLYRYRDGEPYEEQILESEDGDVWMTIVPPSRTFNGFWYKIAGGDAETPEYRVIVRSTPLIERFDVTYHYRPYTAWPDRVSREANLKALRGTEAELVMHTNRPVKEGRLEIETRESKRTLPAELIADDPQAMRARLVMDQEGQYRVWFTTTDDDSNPTAQPYTIRVDLDLPPKVELTKPGADVTLPADGTLGLKGRATDNIGVKEVTLHLKQADGLALQSQPYRPDTPLRLGDLGYPKEVDYQDFVALDQVKDAKGQPFALSKGMVLEYWLEAADACDYPKPNVAESKHFKVNITEPAADKQQQEKERQKADQEKKQHDKKQDEDLKKEKEKRDQEAKENKEQQAGSKGNPGSKDTGTSGKPNNTGEKGANEPGKGAEEAIKNELKEQQSRSENGASKGSQDGKGEKKGDNQASEGPKPDKGGAKHEGHGEGSQNAAGNKDHGSGRNGNQEEAVTKGAGQENGGAGDKASAKGDQPSVTKAAPKPGDASGEAKGGPKGEGQPQGNADKAEAKGGPEKADGQAGARGASKDDPKQRPLASELKRWEEELRRGDDKQSGEAEKRIESLSRNASEKDVRDLAQKILDDARQDRSTAPALPKSPPRNDAKDGPPCECKGGGQGKNTGASKGGDKESGANKQVGNGPAEPGSGRNVGQGRPDDGTSLAGRQEGQLHGFRADEAFPSPADPSHRRWAGALQIEDYRNIDKNILAKILKDHKLTQEEMEAYITKQRTEDAETLPASQGDRLPSSGATAVKTDKTGASGDRTGVGEVPPEFRGAFQDYTRRQAEKK
jgi:collagen type III alpha